MTEQAPYDAVIIGGGPAGLTCAIFLGRYRRRVLVVDGGKPRNYATRAIHGFIGHHGIAPGELLRRGREEAESVGARFCDGLVTHVEREGDLFVVTTDTCGTLRARRLVLAYGIRDTLPDIPGIEEYYGITVHHCPDCDGFESRDQRIGVIGWKKPVVGLALKLMQWTDDVVLFTDGHERDWDEEEQSKLLAEQIDIKDEKIIAIEGNDGAVKAVVLSTGERVAVQRIFFAIHVERSCLLAEELGCEVDPDKPDIHVDEHRKTTVEGVWAIGDLARCAQLAITSAADGAIAAASINTSLLPPGRQV
jgi:thioredoxin reductase